MHDSPGSANRYTPEDQASAVWLSHVAIPVAVTVIMLAGYHRLPPPWFLYAEIGIFVMFLSLVPKWDSPARFVARFVRPDATQGDIARGLDAFRDNGFSVAFALTFVLQYVAMTSLLKGTGGPINSPFAQLTVAFAVFTPLLANQNRTIWIALVASVLYYGGMVWQYGYGGAARPAPGVFVAVTSLIVTLTVVLTFLDKRDAARGSHGMDGGSEESA